MTTVKPQRARGSAQLWGMSLTRALGLMLVPLVIAGLFVWGLWDPTTRMNHVTAAVVNNDEPVEIDGQLTPLGRVFAAELIGATESENFSWQLTDDAGAAEGLASGKYVTVVTIPKNFSAAATSLADGPEGATQATLTVETSERAKLLDAALSAAVTQTATEVLNTQLGEAFVGNVFVGFAELGKGLDTASDGAEQLASGADQLADGSAGLAEGLSALQTGAGVLQQGASQLSGGAGQLANGLGEYAAGVADFAGGAKQAAAGSRDLASGVSTYVDSINGVLVPLLQGLTDVSPQILELRQAIASGQLPVPPEQQGLILGIIDQVLASPELLETAIAGGKDLSAGARASAGGLDELAEGAADLAQGAQGLAQGARELSAGTGALASEVPALTDGVAQLADGAGQLAEGAEQAAEGTHDLAEGLAAAVAEIPRYSDDERETLAEIAVNPVDGGGNANTLFAGTGAPLFLSIALWAGALAAFTLISPLWSRAREAALGEGTITLKSAAPGIALGAAQGAVASFVIALLLSEPASHIVPYVISGILIGVVFALVNQGLVALARGYGRFVAFLVLVTAFVAGIVSTAPGILGSITAFTPVGTAISTVQRVSETGAPGGGNVLMLLVWGFLGLIAIGAAVHRERKPV